MKEYGSLNKPGAKSSSRPLVIAHRGASGLAPENTLAAFRLAIALGADGVEMDVQMTADGVPVVIHDKRLNRTTDGSGVVSLHTLDHLQNLDAGSWFLRRLAVRPRVREMVEIVAALTGGNGLDFSGESMPTLEDTLALLAPAKMKRVYLELKIGRADREALLAATLALVRKYRMEDSVTILSFDHEMVRQAKEAAPEIRTAALFPVAGRALVSPRSILQAVESAGADEAALHFGLATQRAIAALHERGLSVSAWTANNHLVMRRLIRCGVDSIMTNFPNRLISAMQSPHVGLLRRPQGNQRRRQAR
ncbi:MAG TPA: glycerophosphodiester phosphodiesterase family protein [Blastocatellia bacterium]|nr:glycerophosphodiester phosphodiesterase family protein [Blastocatellia bacterium]